MELMECMEVMMDSHHKSSRFLVLMVWILYTFSGHSERLGELERYLFGVRYCVAFMENFSGLDLLWVI